jgi:hypothetical protein
LRVPAEREVGVDSLFQRCDPQLGESLDFYAVETFQLDVRERTPPPQRERLGQRGGGCGGITRSERFATTTGERNKAVAVKLFRRDRELVAVRAGDDERTALGVAKRFAKGRHVNVQRVNRGGRRALAPQLVREMVERDAFVRVEEQRREQRPLLPAAEREHTFAVPDR